MSELFIFRNSNLWLKSYSENSELLRTELKSRVRFLSFVKRNLSCSPRHIILTLTKLEKIQTKPRELQCDSFPKKRSDVRLQGIFNVFLLTDFQKIFRLLAKYVRCLVTYLCINNCLHGGSKVGSHCDRQRLANTHFVGMKIKL
jgi:hypothetical protein